MSKNFVDLMKNYTVEDLAIQMFEKTSIDGGIIYA